jgi:hypothetical protein
MKTPWGHASLSPVLQFTVSRIHESGEILTIQQVAAAFAEQVYQGIFDKTFSRIPQACGGQ